MGKSSGKIVEFRHQTKDAVMASIYNRITRSDIFRAIRTFWHPFAYEQEDCFDPAHLLAIAEQSANLLEDQATLIRRVFGVDLLPTKSSTTSEMFTPSQEDASATLAQAMALQAEALELAREVLALLEEVRATSKLSTDNLDYRAALIYQRFALDGEQSMRVGVGVQ